MIWLASHIWMGLWIALIVACVINEIRISRPGYEYPKCTWDMTKEELEVYDRDNKIICIMSVGFVVIYWFSFFFWCNIQT